MAIISKVTVLQILRYSSLFSTVPIHGRKFKIFGVDGILLILVLAGVLISVENRSWTALGLASFPSQPLPRLPTSASNTGTDRNSSTGSNDNYSSDSPSAAPQEGTDDSDTDGEEVVNMSMIAMELISHTVNMVTRICAAFLATDMQKIHEYVQTKRLPGSWRKWRKNEVFCLLLVVVSIGSGILAALPPHLLYGRKEVKPQQELKNEETEPIITRVLAKGHKAIRHLASIFIGGIYPMECATFFLVCFITLVSNAIKEISDALEIPAQFLPPDYLPESAVSAYPGDFKANIDFELRKLQHAGKSRGNAAKKVDAFHAASVFTLESLSLKRLQPKRVRFSALSERYLEWAELWERGSLVTGAASVLLFFLTTVNLCVSSFLCISSLVDNGFALGTINYGTQMLLRIGRLLALGNAAQFLIDTGKELEEKVLMQFWMEDTEKYGAATSRAGSGGGVKGWEDTDEKERHISYLLHHMSQNPICLSAMGFFVVSRSTLTSIGGVIITYLVVLIQFKSST